MAVIHQVLDQRFPPEKSFLAADRVTDRSFLEGFKIYAPLARRVS
jgi:hypothetical protein